MTKHKKVAIVKVGYNDKFDYDDGISVSSELITNWTEITEEEFNILERYIRSLSSDKYRYRLIEQLPEEEVFNTVQQFVEKAKEKEKQEAALKAERETKKLERERKKANKEKAERKKLFEQLRKELSNDI